MAAAVVAYAQTASTGAINGFVTDPNKALIGNAHITVTNVATGEQRSAVVGSNGAYLLPLLPPGVYHVVVSAPGFENADFPTIHVDLTENQTLNVTLPVGKSTDTVTVSGEGAQIQTESAALGRTIEQEVVTSLPLVNRNFTQILGLTAGASGSLSVSDATAVGNGGGGLSFTGGYSVNGARNYDNNFQMNGVGANDIFASGGNSGGIPIPNPDAIEEFKMQTGGYDASYGRNSGANISLVTRSGGNAIHGSVFEFLRNDALNANSYFANESGTARGELKQNQFGVSIGGPIRKDKLFYFGSYQGTRQNNGVQAECTNFYSGYPLTNDRSAAALGAIYGGQTGALGGVAVAPDGSNINPVAINILNLTRPGGGFLIPTPTASGLYVNQGVCVFDENQGMGNIDWVQSARDTLSGRFFYSKSNTYTPYTDGSTFYYPTNESYSFLDTSLSQTHIFSPTLVNEAWFGFHSVHAVANPMAPFTWTSVGSTELPQENSLPAFEIEGYQDQFAPSFNIPQKTYNLLDAVTWTHGKHNFKFGGGVENGSVDINNFEIPSTAIFLSMADFLLGLPAGPAGNDSYFSNVFASLDLIGDTSRTYREWSGNVYGNDNWHISPRLNINLGLRWERMGDFYDTEGRMAGFDPRTIDPNPAAGGTLAGYFVPSNFPGSQPSGVPRYSNNYGIDGDGQGQFMPRIGFEWNVNPSRNNVIVRGGYGLYYTRLVGQQYLQLVTSPPFSDERLVEAQVFSQASLQAPFPAGSPTFPNFIPYSPTTELSPRILAPNYRPGQTQEYMLGTQTQLPGNTMFELDYVGSRGQDLVRMLSINQALLASPSNPIRGATTNTVLNVQQRVPYEGFGAAGFQAVESEGASWYNSLQATVSKRLSHGMQFIAAYTWAREQDTDGGNAIETAGGNVASIGNQYGNRNRYGSVDFLPAQRLIISYLYQIPAPVANTGFGRLVNGWQLAGVTTFQTGDILTLQGTNGNNVTGITNDRAEIAPGCSVGQLVTSGSIESRLGGPGKQPYFNKSCIAPYPVVGDDGVATGFGNGGVGNVIGPGEQNWDIALTKRTGFTMFSDAANVEFRTEFYNAFNHPIFANPDLVSTDATFGYISSTANNPRIIQFALKLNF
jgi:hypothetical protein